MAKEEKEYAPGIDAIDAELKKVHGGVEGLVFRGLLPLFAEPHPCKMVGAWPIDDPRPHWHMVTYGLSELFEKVSSLPDQSGWGHELTMRVPRREGEQGPPQWAIGMLRTLVQYVYATGHSFGVDHYVPLEDRFEPGATLSGGTFTKDPAFPSVFETKFGRMYFLQLVGITADELTATARVHDGRVVKALAAMDPLLITDPGRHSVFEGPGGLEFPPEPEGGVIAAASLALRSLTFARMFTGWWELGIPYDEATRIAQLIAERMKVKRAFTIASEQQRVVFEPGGEARWERKDDGDVHIYVTPPLLKELQVALTEPHEGAAELPSLPDLRVRC